MANKKKKTLTPEQKLAARKALILFLGIALGLVVLDCVSKWAVQLNCIPNHAYEVIPNFFYITLSYNTGAAFSAGANWGIGGRILGIAISLGMSFVILFYWVRHNEELRTFERVIASLLAAGAVGNLIDRSFYFTAITGFDGVIDFFQFYLGGGPNAGINFLNPFATFNIADACLVVGILLFIVLIIMDTVKNSSKSELREDPRLKKQVKEAEEDEEEEEPKEDEEVPEKKDEEPKD